MAMPTFRCCLGCKRARACETYEGWHDCRPWKICRAMVKLIRRIEEWFY